MKNITLSIICIMTLLSSCKNVKKTEQIKYPTTTKDEVVDTYFGTKVKDPYRWLEDDRSKKTEDWVKTQNEVTFAYLNKIPFKKQIEDRLSKLWNYEKISAPFKEGNYTYFYKNDGLQNQYILYRKKDNNEEVFLNPNTFSKDGTTSLSTVKFSKSGKLVAYSISEGGSDWRKIIVMDVENKKIIGDTLIDVKFSGISWKGDEGFFYSSYEKPKGSELSAKTDQHKLYYHQLNTPQKEDTVIFGANKKRRYVGGYVSEDNHYLFISASNTTSGNELYMIDLLNPNRKIVTLVDNFNNDTSVIDNKNEQLYLVTNFKAPNKRIVTVSTQKPQQRYWKDVIPETENVLNISKGAGFLFASYMIDALSKVHQYNYKGELINEIKLPGLGTATGFSGKKEDTELYFLFTNYNTPSTIYRYLPKENTSKVYWKPAIDFTTEDYESKQVFYNSKDGTKIPMMITYKKGTKLDGTTPTILYGYGGFNVSLTPSFSISNAVWLELGGIYAVPNLRGGGEYGKKWHKAGTKLQKQNVFDDFIAAAEYLIKNKYTSSSKLAISGRSNGGLLVGATMTQRPDLMKVALPGVGVLDMLRYHTFTAGAGWAYDYGTAEDNKEMFEYLKKYSPVHNVKEGVEYPATLVTTGDHDDRVVPAHSFKFAAELQEKQTGDNPTFIRIETNAGHGAGTPVNKIIEQYSDIYSFILFNMGYKKLP